MNIKRPRPPATTAGGGARTHTQRTLDALITSNTGSMKTLEAELVDQAKQIEENGREFKSFGEQIEAGQQEWAEACDRITAAERLIQQLEEAEQKLENDNMQQNQNYADHNDVATKVQSELDFQNSEIEALENEMEKLKLEEKEILELEETLSEQLQI